MIAHTRPTKPEKKNANNNSTYAKILQKQNITNFTICIVRNNNTHIIITYSFCLCISGLLLYDIDIVVCHVMEEE